MAEEGGAVVVPPQRHDRDPGGRSIPSAAPPNGGQGAVQIRRLVVEPLRDAGFRAVPGAIVRRSAYIAPNVVLMRASSMSAPMSAAAQWSTPGRRSAHAPDRQELPPFRRVGIGGVLEPLQAEPVIIEDDCFIAAQRGRRGGIVEQGAVLAMGTSSARRPRSSPRDR